MWLQSCVIYDYVYIYIYIYIYSDPCGYSHSAGLNDPTLPRLPPHHYIYIYIHIRTQIDKSISLSLSLCIYIYIYIYHIHTYCIILFIHYTILYYIILYYVCPFRSRAQLWIHPAPRPLPPRSGRCYLRLSDVYQTYYYNILSCYESMNLCVSDISFYFIIFVSKTTSNTRVRARVTTVRWTRDWQP